MWLRFAHPSKIAFNLTLGFKPCTTDKSIKPGLRNPESTEKRKSVGHGEQNQHEQDQSHQMDQLKVLLKDFVLELPTWYGS